MKSGRKEQPPSEIVGLDFGNKSVVIRVGRREWEMHHTLHLSNKDVYLSRKQSHHCLMDILYLLGIKFAPNASKLRKYYHYDFTDGHNHNTLLKHSQSAHQNSLYLEMHVAMVIRGIISTNPLLRLMIHEQKPIRLVITTFEGEHNPYRLSLQRSLQIAGLNNHAFVTTSHCIAAYYLRNSKQDRDYVERVAVADFGDRGMSVTVYKLYSMERGVVQVVNTESNRLGGLHITCRLADYLVSQLMKAKGMDISSSPKLMHKLKILCMEAKHTLAHSDRAFVRLDELPDIRVFGCEVSQSQFEECIQNDLATNFSMINRILDKDRKIKTIITTGGSCGMVVFGRKMRELIQQREDLRWLPAEPQWAREGLILVKSDAISLLEICPFEIRIEGDDNFSHTAVNRGEAIPLRKKIPMRFPSGELTFSMRFYQDKELIGSSTVPQRPRENSYSLYVEVDYNKVVKWHTTTSFGLIKMNTNMRELKPEDCIEYGETVGRLDYHLENE